MEFMGLLARSPDCHVVNRFSQLCVRASVDSFSPSEQASLTLADHLGALGRNVVLVHG